MKEGESKKEWEKPLCGVLFTNSDPRYAGRLDDKQGGDIIVTMNRVKEVFAFNAKLENESTWLWLTSDQMGFPLRMRKAEEQVESEEVSNSG